MKSAKDEVLSLLEILPDDMSMEELIERIAFKARILRSIEQAERRELTPNEQVMEERDGPPSAIPPLRPEAARSVRQRQKTSSQTEIPRSARREAKAASSSTCVPSDSALASLEPGSAPATR